MKLSPDRLPVLDHLPSSQTPLTSTHEQSSWPREIIRVLILSAATAVILRVAYQWLMAAAPHQP